MKIGIAVDHGGFPLKQVIVSHLQEKGHQVEDFGAFAYDGSDDYPDFVFPLSIAVAEKKVDRGIAICGSGVGANIAANKVAGVRAALITDPFSARQGVEDDDLNLVCIGGRVLGNSLAMELIDIFLNARFSGAERHLRRLKKINDMEPNKPK
ncbi:MAG TPA: RpiB/LacA/LacB family sugar-phosphate isomerase [Flavitalea sp.]|nr:RpiB/LacA/LacB family sugar-phosphate isomerase [Flavitalea sp.]